MSRIDGTVGIAVLRIDQGQKSDLDGLKGVFAEFPLAGSTPYYVRYRLTRISAGADVGTYFAVYAGKNRLAQLTLSPASLVDFAGGGTKPVVETVCAGVNADEFRNLAQGQSLEGCTPFVARAEFGADAPTRVQWMPYDDKVVVTWR